MSRVFMCFSSTDRYTAVDAIMYNLRKYGVDVWYDYHELTLGDDRITGNFDNGLMVCNYAVVIISPGMINSKCGNDELEIIYQRHLSNSIRVFPFFYNIKAAELPEKYKWLTSLIYNEIDDSTGTLAPCRQIVFRLLCDERKGQKCNSIYEYIPTGNEYVDKMIGSYEYLDPKNHNARIAILYAIYCILTTKGVLLSNLCRKSAERIFRETKLNLSFPHKELLIMETIVMTALDSSIEDSHHKY